MGTEQTLELRQEERLPQIDQELLREIIGDNIGKTVVITQVNKREVTGTNKGFGVMGSFLTIRVSDAEVEHMPGNIVAAEPPPQIIPE